MTSQGWLLNYSENVNYSENDVVRTCQRRPKVDPVRDAACRGPERPRASDRGEEPAEVRGVGGRTEVGALPGVAAQPRQDVDLGLRLHALGGDREAQQMGQRHDRPDELNIDGVGRFFPLQSAEEGTVELEFVEGQLSQVGEVGVAGTEVVDGQPYSHVGEGVEGVTGERVGADDGALGDLELELLRAQPAVGQRRSDVVDQVLVPELPAGEVDADERACPAGPEPGEGLPT